MNIIPAIDLLDNEVVRLVQGDYNQKTRYSTNPVELACQFQRHGASDLHVVDLNAAKNPQQKQITLIETIVKSTQLTVQVGGGVRSLEECQRLFDIGVERVVIGSLAINQPEVLAQSITRWGAERFVIAVDCIESEGAYYLLDNAWQDKTTVRLLDKIEALSDIGVIQILCTDIRRDGVLKGPNVALYEMLRSTFPRLYLQASGGVSSQFDLEQLASINVQHCIVGKAIYENKINLEEVM